MTEYTFHTADLVPGAPRMLPEPLTAAALYMSTTNDMTKDFEAFLDQNAISVSRRRNLWMAMIYDDRFSKNAVAQAAYSFLDGTIIREALFIHPLYEAMNFDGYFDNLGSSLFGGLPVHIPRPQGLSQIDA